MAATLILREKEHLIDDVWAFRFTPSEPKTWIAGQYMSVELPHNNPDGKGTKRWFTISSAPFERIMQITTRLTNSSFKQALAALPIGGELLLLDEPHGTFIWQDSDKPLVFVAGGIGITSIRSIFRQRAHDNLPLNAQLIYGNRTEAIVFKEEFDHYAAHDPNFTVRYVVGEPITAAKLAELLPDLHHSIVYASGPTMMVKTLADELIATGFPANQFKEDAYPSYSSKNY